MEEEGEERQILQADRFKRSSSCNNAADATGLTVGSETYKRNTKYMNYSGNLNVNCTYAISIDPYMINNGHTSANVRLPVWRLRLQVIYCRWICGACA